MMTPVIALAPAPSSNFDKDNRAGTHSQSCTTYKWMEIQEVVSIIVTSSTLAKMKHAWNVVSPVFSLTMWNILSTISQPAFTLQCVLGIFGTCRCWNKPCMFSKSVNGRLSMSKLKINANSTALCFLSYVTTETTWACIMSREQASISFSFLSCLVPPKK